MATSTKSKATDDRRDDFYFRRHNTDEHYGGDDRVVEKSSGPAAERTERPRSGRRPLRRIKRGPRQRRTMNFAKYLSEGNYIINQVAAELDVNRNSAARILKAVLHAVRDRIPPEDAVEFAQGLPMALKGVYFDQYDLSRTPVVIRHPEEFMDYVCSKDGRMASYDFPDRRSIEEGVSAVFRVLERTMDYGQVEQIRKLISEELAYMMC